MNIGLSPVRNFGIVDETKKLYRSAQPQYSYEYKWIKNALGVNTIFNLRSELDHDTRMTKDLGIEVKTVNIPDHHIPTLEQANEFIDFVKDNEGILFHCEHGQGRTSTFCVLARLAMGWSLEDAIKEENDVYGYCFKHPEQLSFLTDNFSNFKL